MSHNSDAKPAPDHGPPGTYSDATSAHIVDVATSDDGLAFSALCRRAHDVFPFLPRTVFERAVADQELLVCRNGAGIVGGVHFHLRRDGIATIHEIVVAPGTRGQGIGRALVAAVEARAQSAGIRKIRLKCPVDQPANGFYARNGFTRTGMEAGRVRAVAVWERAVPSRTRREPAWQFYASMTASATNIRRLVRDYYKGYAASQLQPPGDPFERVIVTPLFADPPSLRLFRELASDSPDQCTTRISCTLPRCHVIFDSGGYQVQTGRATYEDLCSRLRCYYAQERWADWYVLPDQVPASADSDGEAAQKAASTLGMGANFAAWYPELRKSFIGVVHGRSEQEMYHGARRWHELGISYLAFGSFGTGGPNGSVNLVSKRSIDLLAALAHAADENGQSIHVFGVGNPEQIRRFADRGIQARSYDSSNWWKMAGFGYVMAGARTFRISQTHRQRGTVQQVADVLAATGHQCPFCAEPIILRTSRWARVLHNLCVFLEGTVAVPR